MMAQVMTNLSDWIFVELNKNKLKVLNGALEKAEVEVDQSIVDDSRINSPEELAPKLKELIKNLKTKPKRMAIMLQEKDIFDRFFVVSGDEVDVTSRLTEQASSYVEGDIKDYYTLFQKVSPFVYQFVGVKKDLLENKAKLASLCRLKLEGILPVSCMLASFVNSRDPFFLIFECREESTMLASEYGGVYFSGTYDLTEDINVRVEKLIQELSTFNREKPVKDIYYYGEEIRIPERFNGIKLQLPDGLVGDEMHGFEKLVIALSLVAKDSGVLNSYINVLSFLQATRSGERSLAKYAPKVLVPLLLVLAFSFFYISYKGTLFDRNQKLDVNGVNETSESASPAESSSSATEIKGIDKATLKIRVENGAGVAGVAGKMKDFLTSLGYTVTEVGNAEKFDYAETQLIVKKTKNDFSETIKKDLEKQYTVKVSDALAETSAYDVLVIVGAK